MNDLIPTRDRLLFHIPAFMQVESVCDDEIFDDFVVVLIEVEGADDNTTWRAVESGSRLHFHVPTGEVEAFEVGRVFALDGVLESL